MKSFAGVTLNGEPVLTVASVDGTYTDGMVLDGGVTLYEFPKDVTDHGYLMERLFWKSEWLLRDKKPSEIHEWEPESRQWVVAIERLRAIKSQEISDSCASNIVSGFVSSSLGSKYKYPSAQTDQLNLTASVVDSYNPSNASDWTTAFWCADDLGVWRYMPHTAEQIRQAGADGKKAIAQMILKNAALQVQIQQATSKEELDLIVW